MAAGLPKEEKEFISSWLSGFYVKAKMMSVRRQQEGFSMK